MTGWWPSGGCGAASGCDGARNGTRECHGNTATERGSTLVHTAGRDRGAYRDTHPSYRDIRPLYRHLSRRILTTPQRTAIISRLTPHISPLIATYTAVSRYTPHILPLTTLYINLIVTYTVQFIILYRDLDPLYHSIRPTYHHLPQHMLTISQYIPNISPLIVK